MPTEPKAARIFLAAVKLTSPTARAAFLDQACAGDPALRAEVEALLAAHDEKAAKEIFLAAVGLTSHAVRAAFLDQACAADPVLRRRVEALLSAHDDPDDMPASEPSNSAVTSAFDPPRAGDQANDASPPRVPGVGPGSRVGPYKLLRMIGLSITHIVATP